VINNYSNISSKIAGFFDNQYQFIFSGLSFNNSIAAEFADNFGHSIFVGLFFNNSIASGFVLPDKQYQIIFFFIFF
jgi:hypothetical protein